MTLEKIAFLKKACFYFSNLFSCLEILPKIRSLEARKTKDMACQYVRES